jgi:two-component system cell cycle response regulator CpdR
VKRILVVDDESSLCSLIQRILTRRGYSVEIATSGHKAMDLCATTQFDLVLSDVIMPGTDGHTLARWVAANYPNTRTALMSARDPGCQGCPYAPRCYVLPKPFSSAALSTFVTKALTSQPLTIADSAVA